MLCSDDEFLCLLRKILCIRCRYYQVEHCVVCSTCYLSKLSGYLRTNYCCHVSPAVRVVPGKKYNFLRRRNHDSLYDLPTTRFDISPPVVWDGCSEGLEAWGGGQSFL